MLMPARSEQFPRMHTLRQALHTAPLADVRGTTLAELRRLGLEGRIGPGKRVAIGAGSRGIADIAVVVRAIVDEVRRLGGEPFIFPAMGSHGGATPAGQREVLATLGIDERTMGCAVLSSMEVDEIGHTPAGVPVYLDRHAAGADAIIAVNRIKAHTNFRGHVESGLCKMLAIGMGKHAQAIAIHALGMEGLQQHMPAVARVVMERAPVIAGVAILEDATHRVSCIAAFAPHDLEAGEARLLDEHRASTPRLPVEDLDLLIVDRIGKDISGTGMDTNVIGRCRLLEFTAFPTPRITAIIGLDLTEDTHGNAIGMGACDVVTKRLADKIDRASTYVNCLTGQCPQLAAMPIVADTDREALRLTIDYLLSRTAPRALRAIRIRDTLTLGEMQVSEALVDELRGRADCVLVGEAHELAFTADGALR